MINIMRTASILQAAIIGTVVLTTTSYVWSATAKDVFAEVSSSVVVVRVLDKHGETMAQGSGVVVGRYEVVTNCHVLSEAASITVLQAADRSGGKGYRMAAFLLESNDERDLCLLFVDELSVPPVARPVRLGSTEELSVGEEVYAVGAPAGLELSLSRGIVSQLRSMFGKRANPLIQTDAAISPGSSGGGLFNRAGELVGITTFKWRGENLNFALPSEWVKELRLQGRSALTEAVKGSCLRKPKYTCVIGLALHEANSEDNLFRFDHLLEIAAAQKKIGDIGGAQQTLAAAARYAVNKAKFLGILGVKGVKQLADVFVAQTKTGDKRAAKHTYSALVKAVNTIIGAPPTSKIYSNQSRYQAMAYLASALAKTGDISSSLEAVSPIDNRQKVRGIALADIARAHAEAGDVANAMKTAMSIHDVPYRGAALGNIISTQAKAGDFKGAIKTVMSTKIPPILHGLFLSVIAARQLAGGDMEAAQRTIALSSDDDHFWLRRLSSVPF